MKIILVAFVMLENTKENKSLRSQLRLILHRLKEKAKIYSNFYRNAK